VFPVNRTQSLGIGGLVLAVAIVSGFVAYRAGLRRSQGPAAGWPGAGHPPDDKCVDIREAVSRVGTEGCVSGRVLRVFTSRAGNTFLDFCPDYRTCPFSSVIFASDRQNFGDLGILTGKDIEIRGLIRTYEGRAEIAIHDSQQIRLAQ
jgi:DNA/RNA endonuclease YhcR with UshA esterase domain